MSALLLLCCSGCKHDKSADQIALELRARLLPPGGFATEPAPAQRSGTTLSTGWEINSSFNRADFANWITGSLKPDFIKTDRDGNPLIFTKYASGEAETFQITITEAAQTAARAQVCLTFTPD